MSRTGTPPDESGRPVEDSASTEPLCEQFGLTHANVLERRMFLRLQDEDDANMAVVRRIIEARVDAIIDRFYAHLASFPPLLRYLKDARTIERLKRTQRDYLLGLGRDSAGLDYVEHRLRVGVAHDRVSLDPKWFLAGYGVLFDLMSDYIARDCAAQGGDPVPLILSLSKALWFDAGLAVDTYNGALMERAAKLLSDLVVAEKRLAALSGMDELTDVPNRRSLMASLEAEFERSERYKHDFAVLFADIDHFKRINDRYGHDAGDTVLREVAKVIRRCLRPSDIVGRYGGEEFVVGLAHAGVRSAMQVAERVRQTVENTPIRDGGHEIGLTVSIGIAAKGPDLASVADVIACADEAMYRAKSEGRNRICGPPEASLPGTTDSPKPCAPDAADG